MVKSCPVDVSVASVGSPASHGLMDKGALMHSLARPTLSTIAALMMLAQPIFAFQSPLSDESVREAYFLGQRHDGSLEGLVEKSTRRFPAPKTGPYISSVILVQPFG